MWSFILMSIPVLAVMLVAGSADFAHAQGKLQCDSRSPGGDAREIECPLPSSGTTRNFRFKSHFAGSHDDTTAAITTTLNGSPLACGPGSKTSLMGEDGEVSLECRFAVTELTGARQILRVKVVWRHAQYLDSELSAE